MLSLSIQIKYRCGYKRELNWRYELHVQCAGNLKIESGAGMRVTSVWLIPFVEYEEWEW